MPTKRNNDTKEFAIGTKIEYNGKLYEFAAALAAAIDTATVVLPPIDDILSVPSISFKT